MRIDHVVVRYGFAVVATGLMIGLTEVLQHGLTERVLFMPAMLAVMTTGLLAGLGPAVLSIVVGVVAIDYRYIEPIGSIGAMDPADQAFLVAFLLMAAVAAAVAVTARRARAEAESTSARLEALQASMPVGVTFVDNDGRYVSVNQYLADVNGIPAPDHIGRRVSEIVPPDIAAMVQGIQAQILRTGEAILDVPFSGLVRGREHEGERHLLMSFFPVRLDGTVIGMGGTMFDVTTLRNAEAIIRQQAEQFHLLAETLAVMVWRMAPYGKATYLNAAALAYFGIEAMEHVADDWHMTVHPDDGEAVKAAWLQGMESCKPYVVEGRLQRSRDGMFRWHLIHGSPLIDDKGTIVEWLGTSTDIHDQRQIRDQQEDLIDQLRQTEEIERQKAEEFRLLAENLSVQVFRLKHPDIICYANSAAVTYTGVNADTRHASYWRELICPDDMESVLGHWLQARDAGAAFTAEGRLLRAGDGMYRWHLLQATPIFNDQGGLEEWLATATDIHDQKQALAEREDLIAQLRKAEGEQRRLADDFRLLADMVPHIIWTKPDPEHTDFINRRGLDYSGMTSGVRATSDSMQLVHPDDMERRRTWERAMAEGTECSVEARMRRHDGVYRWQLIQNLPVRDQTGRIVRWIGCATDIDDHKQALQLRETFLSVASHELKTPITALLLQLHVLKRRMGDADPALLQRLDVASRHGERLTKLVNNLLDVSRIVSGRFDDPQPLPLREVVDEVVDRFGPELETTALTVVEDSPGPVVGHWDRLHVDQILTNLLTNAFKYGQGSRIEVRMGLDGDDACLAVSDGGPGIAAADLDRVFLQYHRLSSSDGPPGHGLGLWIVQHLTERMGGRVSVHSRPGEGATFTVRLPLNPA